MINIVDEKIAVLRTSIDIVEAELTEINDVRAILVRFR